MLGRGFFYAQKHAIIPYSKKQCFQKAFVYISLKAFSLKHQTDTPSQKGREKTGKQPTQMIWEKNGNDEKGGKGAARCAFSPFIALYMV